MSLKLVGASYQIDGNHLLQEINLSLQSSSINALIGPNGAGKTTLLRVASEELIAGQVTPDDTPVADIALEERARRITFLTQNSALDFPSRDLKLYRWVESHTLGTKRQ
tara:strand:+ start:813 stop:1139 length:327 start_codon:yes stop_codon:yes gene_type:complete